jgi:hypothetical protein
MVARISVFAASAFAAVCALAPHAVHAAPVLPRITRIAITPDLDGTFSATISGTNFGAAPGDVPCTSCTPAELRVVDLSNQPTQQVLNVTSWSDTSIIIAEVPVALGDAARVEIYNGALNATAAIGGHVGKVAGPAVISGIGTSGSGQNLVITINGSGFGSAPSVVGTDGVSPYLLVTDFNVHAPDTNGYTWNAGFCGANDCDGVTLNYASWTDTQIVIDGFGGSYGYPNQVNKFDSLCLGVWSSTSTSNGTTGGTTKCTRVHGGR